MESTSHKNSAAFLHLSVLSQYLIPFGNFILPMVIWAACREKSSYVDANGRNTINFQLSLLLYTIALAFIAIPILVYYVFRSAGTIHGDNIFTGSGVGPAVWLIIVAGVFVLMKLAEILLVVLGAVKAANGQIFRYPATIGFIKSSERQTSPVTG